jgi:cation diffusion facilitator CzcD-associated flavoprotein CzcO
MEHFDVMIVGAGLSGIGAAYHLQAEAPRKSYVILEGRDAIGGTWDLFRYPGIRSDSDMFTLGYNFKPWTEAKAIADGPSIRKYVRATASENGIDKNIRFNHMVKRASWDSSTARWTVEAETAGQIARFTCNFLFMCSGYYAYSGGHDPEFTGRETFKGRIVHPQKWPEDLDYTGKRVVVIGSGATAVTLIPAMAKAAAHVTML